MIVLKALSCSSSPPTRASPASDAPSTRPATLELERSSNYPATLKLKLERNAKNTRIKPSQVTDIYQILKSPVITEAAMKQMIENNTLVFKVDMRADKTSIKDAVEKLYSIRSQKVNTSISPDGTKKAFVKLTTDFNAVDVATKTGIF